jgi:hypothetical protein
MHSYPLDETAARFKHEVTYVIDEGEPYAALRHDQERVVVPKPDHQRDELGH